VTETIRRRPSRRQRVWLLTGGLAAAAAVLHLAVVGRLAPVAAPMRLPWWGLAVMFALAEVLVVHIELRRDAHSFSLSEIPLVLGLVFATPSDLLLAQVVGAAVALIAFRRQDPTKLAFNLALFVLITEVALALFHVLGGASSPTGTMSWAAIAAAALASGILSALLIAAVIGISDEWLPVPALVRSVSFGVITTITNAALALIAVLLLWSDPAASWLIAVPTVLLFLSYRAYAGERRRRESLDHLYRSSRRLQRSIRLDETMRDLLEEARGMFRAEIAEMILLGGIAGESASRRRLGPGDELQVDDDVTLDPTQGIWARVVAEDRTILLSRPIANERLRAYFEKVGMRDLMAAPLHAEGEVVGILRVANRMGDVSTFNEEDLKPFETLARQASTAFENARLVHRLEEALARQTEINRMKDDFISTVSHELRTPLTIVQGFLSTVLNKSERFSAEQEHDFLVAAERGAKRLGELIEQILVAARIESGRGELTSAPVVLPAMVRSVIEELVPRQNGHRIRIELPEAFPVLVTDGGRLYRILANLLDNAFKYSDPGDVRIGGEALDGRVIVWVADDGPGIPAEHRDRIFDRFYQADSSSTRPAGGTGLGLYICRRLAEELGGRLWLERAERDGTEFRLELPLQARGVSTDRVVDLRPA